MTVWDEFLAWVKKASAPRILEIGTRQWKADTPTTAKPLLLSVNPSCEHVGLDMLGGLDVDVIIDAHELSKALAAASFDAFLCRSALEHFRRPWVVARELAAVVKPGGMGFVQTHQAFPTHGYPHDYFRFTREALAELFAPDVGWEVVRSEYEFPCRILPTGNHWPHAAGWNFEAEAWLNVCALVRRIEP